VQQVRAAVRTVQLAASAARSLLELAASFLLPIRPAPPLNPALLPHLASSAARCWPRVPLACDASRTAAVPEPASGCFAACCAPLS